ncbi:hypothetical protein [Actinopolymorpha sp. B9G3]|uniref:hypothetical protein n=1 Tax=Actinopolymorpha sp. B9G3 TaxID=3158970 RepID=UPI0032D90298
MVTPMAVGNSDDVRRCDAHCPEATEPDCDCICGSRYHGQGLDAARQHLHQDLRAGRLGPDLAAAVGDLEAHDRQEVLF